MLRYVTFAIFLALGAVTVWLGGQQGALSYERMQVERVRQGLTAIEIDWVRLRSDGLRIELHGRAPSAEAQALAATTARATAPRAHIVDFTSATITPVQREPLLIEFHRDPAEITATGRVPSSSLKAVLARRVARAAPDLVYHDLTGIGAARPGPAWGPELALAVAALGGLTEAYIRVEPARVHIQGAVPDAATRDRLHAELVEIAGTGPALTLDLRVPLATIMPFRFAAWKDRGGLRLEACTARSAAEQNVLTAALARHGAADMAVCDVGLGGPEGDWAGAISASLTALSRLPAGRVDITYRSVILEGAAPTEARTFAGARAALAEALPEGYAMAATLGPGGEAAALPRQGYWLDLKTAPGEVTLAGRLAGESERRALLTFAAATFPGWEIRDDLALGEGAAPPFWHRAAQEALLTLTGLDRGEVRLTAGRLVLSGRVADPALGPAIRLALAATLPEFDVSTRFEIDLAAAIADLPHTPETCLAAANRALSADPIVFAVGSAEIAPESAGVLDAVAAGLGRCEAIAVEIGGHT
ncbi:MAG: hypothetical protein AAF908_04295, partial [Pseudomonadota bacterium]